MLPQGYTPEEVAQALRLQASTVREYARSGLIRGRKVGNLWRFSAKAVEDFLEGDRCHLEESPTESTTQTSTAHLEGEYANLVELATKRQQKNGTPNS